MPGTNLYPYQQKAIEKMKNGCILCGGVGSGKSRTALAYYYKLNGGVIGSEEYVSMKNPKDLYIITTARKRDTFEWESEMIPFQISTKAKSGLYTNTVVVDSWNNISKYKNVYGAFFIFDEQRVVGSGTWVKAFLNIARKNEWILLSATPGDTWQDYIPVFVANGFYKNRTAFKEEHMVYTWVNGKYPKIERYLNTGKLIKFRNSILVNMDFERKTVAHHIDIPVEYDNAKYKDIIRNRWDYEKNAPIENASQFCYMLRKVVNADSSRVDVICKLLEEHSRVIIFYNFDYELDILKSIPEMCTDGHKIKVAEWNGHKHQPIPESRRWIYLVQYTAGAEGWNCIKTDTIIFYSQSYSYKVMVQAAGRIDRLNTPFTDLYYYHLKSHSNIDIAISRALKSKKSFNETGFYKQGS